MAGGAADGGAQEPAAAAVLLLRESFQQLASVPSGQGEGLASTALPGCLVSERFLQHTDREVRLWTARCLAEALRIREPGPGWLELGRLPAVLGLFVEQVGLLLDPAGPVRAGALEFVERLADWGSGSVFALAFQHPDPGGLVAALVEACLQAARGERPEGASEADDPDRAERALCRLVSSVLVDAEELPAPEIAVLPLIDELKPAHSKSPARRFVRCTLEELARRDAALVVDLALQAQLFPTVAEEAESVVPPPEAYKPLLSVVRQLFEVDRALVARTLPRLGALLRCRDAECRGAVTRLFGRLLAHPFAEGGAAQAAAPAAHPLPAQAALLATHPLLLEGFLERFDDGEALVRLAALKGGAALLAAAAALVREGRVRWGGEARGLMGGTGDDQALVDAAGEAAARLVQRRLDPDEGVRLRVVEVATEAAEGARSADELRLVEEALPLIFERVLDRRGPKLREACARCMAQLFAKHARSRWTSGEEATGWEWVPRLLCQAYSVFLASHTGGVALLEELIEVHLLGCAMAGDAASQARALRGLFEAACEQEDSAAGLRLLLCRKRDANAALWQFLRRRRGHTGGRLQDAAAAADALACCKAEGGQLVQAGSEAALALEAFGRFNPQLEEPRARLEAHLEALGALEAVKDRAVWDHLGKLCSPAAAFATADRQPLLLELQRLLKVHRLGALWPLLRRALLCTWLLPDQVPALLEARPGAPAAARRLIAELPKYFPGAFAHHAEAVAGRLVGAVPPEGSLAALRSLAAAGKRRAAACDGGEPWPEAPPGLDPKRYTDALLEAVAAQAPDRAARGPACRKAVHALGLLPPEELGS
ncbi:unnamed protein product [Prorocentrum cordatum]|uniref:HEAT repeat-containing protein 1 n=1 Tax=Prorocentrum cordatum TaxID=2364126 RepID=A0ABN9UTH5_9DINO|nr:unnamed protein product [Polarella glacialis]